MRRITERRLRSWRRARRPFGLIDPESDAFGMSGLARRVESPAARLLVLPGRPESSDVEFEAAFWEWWEGNHPDPATGGAAHWGSNSRACSFAALRCDERSESVWSRCLALHRSGALEMTLGGEAAFAVGNPARRMFRLSVIVGRVWAALSLCGEIASRFAIVGPFEVGLAILGTEGAVLSGFGRDWEEPTEFYGDFGHCYERNLWIRKELIDWPDAAGIKSLAFTLGRIEDAWGIRQRRFLFCKGPQAGEFDPAKYRWW